MASYTSIVALLKTALLLLTLAQGPNVPKSLHDQAVSVANQAIAAATQALSASPSGSSASAATSTGNANPNAPSVAPQTMSNSTTPSVPSAISSAPTSNSSTPTQTVAAPSLSSFSSALFDGSIELVQPAHYSFGSSVDNSGAVYFAEYNHTRLMKYAPADGRLVPILQNTGGMYGVAADTSGNVYVSIDSETNTGKLISVSQNGAVQTAITGLRRPRQVSIGDDGNVYVVLESDGKIMRWNPLTGQSDTVVNGLNTPQSAVEKNGNLYWIEYGSFGSKGEALSPGRIQKRAPDGTITTIADGIWRGRGLVVRSDGTLIGASEANDKDQGNSGYLFSIIPGGQPVLLAGGLDYPQFPSVSNTGVIYLTLARDNWLASYIGKPQQSTWPSGQSAKWFQGSIAASGGDPVTIAIGNVSLAGSIPSDSSLVLKGWVRISADQVSVGKVETSYGTNDVPTPGVFPLPTITCTRASGAACTARVIVERNHIGSRWPMDYRTGRELPAPGFSETPVAYWVYLDSDPATAATQRNWSLIVPSLERYLQRHFEGLLRRKASSFVEMSGWFDYIKNGNLSCKDISNSFLGTDEWKNEIASLTDTQVITYLYQGLLGIDPDQPALQYSLNLRQQSQLWSRVTGEMMNTSLYSQVCSQDWH